VISIVVPTFKEAGNIPNLARQLQEALRDIEYELLIADDDSPDDTVEICLSLAQEFPLRLIQSSDRPRDLSLSVIDGIVAARGEQILVMDADLSHPPQMIPRMLQALAESPDAFVIGSRYVNEGSFDRDWSLWRFLNSHIATMMARPLVSCSDPMSGFFLFDRKHIDVDSLRPIGYKIGLEIMVRGTFSSIVELPIQFKDREVGDSKMNLDQQFKYLRHLRRLYLFRFGSLAEFFHFGLIGASGFLIDIVFYYGLQLAGFSHLVARGISFWPAVSWNWILNGKTTFGERQTRSGIKPWFELVVASLISFLINYGLYAWLTTSVVFFAEYRILALVAGIGGASLFNFAASTLFVYSDKRA